MSDRAPATQDARRHPRRLRVLLVIHGYPPRYNAGSEVYTQLLAHGLADHGVQVAVFAREEDPGEPDYRVRVERDESDLRIPVFIVNHARSAIRVQNAGIDSALERVLAEFRPDIVHFGHLSHLSTGLVAAARRPGARVVFTLHDFWLMCPRGQFLQWGLTPDAPWALCDGQENRKCATKCFNRYFTGTDDSADAQYWTSWIGARMEAVRAAADLVDLFIAPSRHVLTRHVKGFGLEGTRVRYLDYGFERDRMRGQERLAAPPVVFGYVGRHHPSKGLPDLIRAFCQTRGSAVLRIWGFATPEVTASIRRLAGRHAEKAKSIEWRGPFVQERIGQEVFDHCHCIVVPSIWEENSPLVIHEAQQARVPVITAAMGGMGEYVQDGVNGLTFRHRDVDDLARALQRAIDDPHGLVTLGTKGFLYSEDGNVPSIQDHARTLIMWYRELLSRPTSPPEQLIR